MRIYIYLVRIDLKFYKLLSKKEKKIKKHQFFHNSSYLLNHCLCEINYGSRKKVDAYDLLLSNSWRFGFSKTDSTNKKRN